jgi:hypothetical protein
MRNSELTYCLKSNDKGLVTTFWGFFFGYHLKDKWSETEEIVNPEHVCVCVSVCVRE